MPHLEDTSGRSDHREVVLSEREIVIGRDPTACDVCFPDDLVVVSRIHASVRWDAQLERCILRDEGSMNGTFLMGRAASLVEGEDVPVEVGQEFYVGHARLRFRLVR